MVEKDWLAFGHPFADRMGIPTVTDLASSSSTEMLTRQSSYGGNPSSSPLRSQSGSNLPVARGGATHGQASDNFSPILLQVAIRCSSDNNSKLCGLLFVVLIQLNLIEGSICQQWVINNI